MSFKHTDFKTLYREKILEYLLVATIGGVFYFALEVIWRGWSHISMAFCGALCFTFFSREKKTDQARPTEGRDTPLFFVLLSFQKEREENSFLLFYFSFTGKEK